MYVITFIPVRRAYWCHFYIVLILYVLNIHVQQGEKKVRTVFTVTGSVVIEMGLLRMIKSQEGTTPLVFFNAPTVDSSIRVGTWCQVIYRPVYEISVSKTLACGSIRVSLDRASFNIRTRSFRFFEPFVRGAVYWCTVIPVIIDYFSTSTWLSDNVPSAINKCMMTSRIRRVHVLELTLIQYCPQRCDT